MPAPPMIANTVIAQAYALAVELQTIARWMDLIDVFLKLVTTMMALH